MKSIRDFLRINQASGRRGSALLVTLMVMVGLSLLGLGFVAISETESAISINERNAAQTLSVAEAGARTVVEWFNNPNWALKNELMPANTNAIKQERKASVPGNAAGVVASYTGYYKPDTASTKLFDLPLKGDPSNRFFGTDEKSADIVINRTTAATFLDTLNARLFTDTGEGGRISEILVYAPPILAPYTPNTTEWPAGSGKKFWNGGTRYGVATIKVTATKTQPLNCILGTDTPCQLVSQRAVKIVISEFPFPGPEGPLQSQVGIETGGSFDVHWGKIVSMGDLALKKDLVGLPWHDAWTPFRFELGYDETASSLWPAGAGQHYLYELIGKTFDDPWFQARARGDITTDNSIIAEAPPETFPICSKCQPDPYQSINQVENVGIGSWNSPDFTKAGFSNEFQSQMKDISPYRREVIFPRIDYKFWKQIATAAVGNSGIKYLRYDGGTTGTFHDRAGVSKTFPQWVNTVAGAKEGFYFFDTVDGSNPQLADGSTDTSKLTPAIELHSSDGNPLQMRGFVYLNALEFGSSGVQGPQGYYNAPAEPFRDIGFQEVDDVTTSATYLQKKVNADGSPHKVNYTNYQWDYEDVNKNGKFDVVVAQRASQARDGTDNAGALVNEYFVVPYSYACASSGGLGTACSEPHEPYLNLIGPWPDACCAGGGLPNPFTVRWEAQALGSQTRQPKNFQNDGVTPIACTAASSLDDCTSNGYDKVGPLMHLKSTEGPILDGVLYNEGSYATSGGAVFYGSVVVRGGSTSSGSSEVWFDNRLTTGNWEQRFKNLSRVVVTSHETDQ